MPGLTCFLTLSRASEFYKTSKNNFISYRNYGIYINKNLVESTERSDAYIRFNDIIDIMRSNGWFVIVQDELVDI